MRNLVITRKKSFVACLGTMKVYIEDPLHPEITISGVPCRMLGTLKNGEEKAFPIDEDARRIFVIADKLSKDFACESYPLPEGTEDIRLTGKNHYNPTAGNPFYFDGNTDPTALASRKKGKRFGIILLVCAILAGFAIGFLINKGPREKVFTCDEMQITLTNQFAKTEYMGYQAVYRSKQAMVFVVKDSFSLYPELRSMSLKEYGNAVREANNRPNTSAVKTENGVTYFEYDVTADGIEYNYFTALYRSEKGFWIIQFVSNTKDADKLRPDFIEWAQSVTFKE